MVLAREKLVADSRYQFVRRLIQSPADSIGRGSTLLQDSIRRNHFRRYELATDAEMLKGALRLSSPKFVDRHFNRAQTVVLHAMGIHRPPCIALRGPADDVGRRLRRTTFLTV